MLRFGKFVFTPTLIPSLATLLLMVLLLGLGFWQLDRADQKQVLQDRFQTFLDVPYTDLSHVPLHDPASRYRKVTVQGRYDGERQILLDNQVYQGRPGYHVFTPMRRDGYAEAILVNRGWVPLGVSRQQLPDISVNKTHRLVRGRVSQPANPGLRLPDPPKVGNDWPQVVQYLDYAQLSQQLGYPLDPAVILLDPDMQEGYLRAWQPTFAGLGPARHRGYAVQWFALAAALAVIYGIVNTRLRRVNH